MAKAQFISKSKEYAGYNAVLAETGFTFADIEKVTKLSLNVIMKLKRTLVAKPLTREEIKEGVAPKEDLITFLIPYDIKGTEVKRLWIGIPVSMFEKAEKDKFKSLVLTQYQPERFLALPQ